MFIQELQDYHGKTIFKESAWLNRVEGEEKNFLKYIEEVYVSKWKGTREK